ncbi:hypothetical protein Dsin_022597 [Dipteronia sinensis]|uniref:Uncharacterized protein n=1 Tax=Dipteronia sinensis TaxID=43782 RepID=A0AAE0E1A5_9ROSI|nr:hypothetical protein Dsin_022597 [Dipteronia sinensis]
MAESRCDSGEICSVFCEVQQPCKPMIWVHSTLLSAHMNAPAPTHKTLKLSHKFSLEATKSAAWDNEVDHLKFSYNGQDLAISEPSIHQIRESFRQE